MRLRSGRLDAAAMPVTDDFFALLEFPGGPNHPASPRHEVRARELPDDSPGFFGIDRVDFRLVMKIQDTAWSCREHESMSVQREPVGNAPAVIYADAMGFVATRVDFCARRHETPIDERAGSQEADVGLDETDGVQVFHLAESRLLNGAWASASGRFLLAGIVMTGPQCRGRAPPPSAPWCKPPGERQRYRRRVLPRPLCRRA